MVEIKTGNGSSSGKDGDGVSDLFDPFSEGLAGEVVTYISLRQRGKVIQKVKEAIRRRESYSVNTRKVSSAMNQHKTNGSSPCRITRNSASTDTNNRTRSPINSDIDIGNVQSPTQAPHMSSPSAVRRSSTHMRFVMDESEDDLDELVEQRILSSRGDGSGNTSGSNSPEEVMMVANAIVALWTHRRVAAGFRQWKEVSQMATDASQLENYGLNLNMDARKILITAESVRQNAAAAYQIDPTSPHSNREPPSVHIFRKDLDSLILWARNAHPKTFRGVDDASICDVMRNFRFRQYQDGDTLFFEGESGETFYVIVQGTIAVFVGMNAHGKSKLSSMPHENRQVKIDWTQLGKRVFTYRTGDSFGETAMFCNDATRTATAVAVGPCEVCELHRDVYRRTLRKYHQVFFEQAQKLNFIQRVSLFLDWPRQKLTTVADLLEKRRLAFGEALLVEKAIEPVNQCYLVLSGALKVSKTVEFYKKTPCHDETAVLPTSRIRKFKRKPKGYLQLKVELHTVVANEIVALEALIEPNQRGTYTVTAATASVEVYVLKEIDARVYIGTPQTALYQKVRQQCDAEADHRTKRIELARLAMSGHEASKERAALENDWTLAQQAPLDRNPPHAQDTLDVAMLISESHSTSTTHDVHKIGVVVAPPASTDSSAPYLPQLRPTHISPSDHVQRPLVQLLKTADSGPAQSSPSPARRGSQLMHDKITDKRVDKDVGTIVASPKMLSACVRKFIFEHSETLASNYAERLSQQFPTFQPQSQPLMSPTGKTAITSALGSESAHRSPMIVPPLTLSVPKPPPSRKMHMTTTGLTGKSSRVTCEEQRVLEQQMSKLSKQKMHWDADKKAYVAMTPNAVKHLLTMNTARVGGGGTGEHVRGAATSRDVSELHHQQRSMQQTARRLVEAHLKRVQQRIPNNSREESPFEHSDPLVSTSSKTSTFLHFFADT